MAFDLDPSYRQVPERIADFKAKHPEGCLRPADPLRPFWVESIGGRDFIVYVAAAYRSPDDPTPGIGVAWEPFPGKTPYTKDSELQNCETSAWGRAIVASLASVSKSVASAEDVRNRQADQGAEDPPEVAARKALHNRIVDLGDAAKDRLRTYCDEREIPRSVRAMTETEVEDVVEFLDLDVEPSETAPESPESAADDSGRESPTDAREAPLPPCAICGSFRAARAVERGVTRCSDAAACTKRVEEKAGG